MQPNITIPPAAECRFLGVPQPAALPPTLPPPLPIALHLDGYLQTWRGHMGQAACEDVCLLVRARVCLRVCTYVRGIEG